MAKVVKKMFTWSTAPVYIADQEVDPPSRSDVSYCVLTQPSYLGWLSKPAAWEALQQDPLSCSSCFLFHSHAGAPKIFSCMITHAQHTFTHTQTHTSTHTHTHYTNIHSKKKAWSTMRSTTSHQTGSISMSQSAPMVRTSMCVRVWLSRRQESVAGVDNFTGHDWFPSFNLTNTNSSHAPPPPPLDPLSFAEGFHAYHEFLTGLAKINQQVWSHTHESPGCF